MSTYVDHNYFKELGKNIPTDICRNNRCSYDPTDKSYRITVWENEYIVDWENNKIERSGEAMPHPHAYFYLFIIYYLLLPDDIKLQGEWISEKDLPGGVTFFRGPHLLPTKLMSDRFGNDLEGFCDCCRKLGGTPLKLADAAFSFPITKDISIAILFWVGDEDFPAEAKILYDRAIINHLPLDIVYALAVEACARLGSIDLVPPDLKP